MRSPVSNRAKKLAGVLVVFHFVAWGYVAWQDVLYDQVGFDGLLWWLVSFLILPAIALLVLAGSYANRAFGLWGDNT